MAQLAVSSATLLERPRSGQPFAWDPCYLQSSTQRWHGSTKHFLPQWPHCACPKAKFQTPDRNMDIMPPATFWYDFSLAFLYSRFHVFYILLVIRVSSMALVPQLLKIFPSAKKEPTSYYFPATVLERDTEHIQPFSAKQRGHLPGFQDQKWAFEVNLSILPT